MTDAALYYHFPSRDVLLRTIAEQLTSEFRLPRRSKDWRRWMERFARALRNVLKEHPGAANYLVVGGPVGANQLKIVNHALGILSETGFSPRESWFVYTTIVNFVLRQSSAEEQVDREIVYDRLTNTDTSLPHLSRAMAAIGANDNEAYFDFGLRALLNGIGLEKKRSG